LGVNQRNATLVGHSGFSPFFSRPRKPEEEADTNSMKGSAKKGGEILVKKSRGRKKKVIGGEIYLSETTYYYSNIKDCSTRAFWSGGR